MIASSIFISSEPLVSTRVSLRWPPALPQELTNTLVLTGRTGFFLDLRVFTHGPRKGEIDWATAGRKSWLGDSHNSQARFTSIVDSRTTFLSSLTSEGSDDVGSFFSLPNGDVLETGEMRNPDKDNAVEAYEEIWRRFPVEKGTKVIMLQGTCPQGGGSQDETQSRGGEATSSTDLANVFVGRIGTHQLGLGEDGKGGFLAKRYILRGERWDEVYSVGGSEATETLPVITSTEAVPLAGKRVLFGGREWIVLENSGD